MKRYKIPVGFIPFLFIAATLSLCACEPSMNHRAKLRSDAPSNFFSNGALNQHAMDGTVDRSPSQQVPTSVSMQLLRRGQNRYMIYCAPCHGDTGDGRGMIVQHGFLSPPSLYSDQIRAKPRDFFVDVMTNGFGAMYSYADRLSPEDRWAVASYIQALQLSQHFSYQNLTDEEKIRLSGH
jgi:mono/diheme cytochrome c family protein